MFFSIILLSAAVSVPSAQEIVNRTIAATAENERQKQSLTFERVQVTEDLSGHEVMSARESQPVVAPLIDQDSPRRFTFSLNTPGIVDFADGHRYYILDFRPTGKVKPRTDDEVVLNHIQGTVYIDPERFLIMRLEGHLEKPFRTGFLGLAKISEFTIVASQEECDGIVVPLFTSHVIHYRTPLSEVYERETDTYQNFQPRLP